MAITTIWSDQRRYALPPDIGRTRFEAEGAADPVPDRLWAEFMELDSGRARFPEGMMFKPPTDAAASKTGNHRGRKRKPGLYRDRLPAQSA